MRLHEFNNPLKHYIEIVCIVLHETRSTVRTTITTDRARLRKEVAFENDLRKERQSDGIALAKRRGVQFGSKPVLNSEQISQMRLKRSEGVKIRDLMTLYGGQ
jgi:hypothetical protein